MDGWTEQRARSAVERASGVGKIRRGEGPEPKKTEEGREPKRHQRKTV